MHDLPHFIITFALTKLKIMTGMKRISLFMVALVWLTTAWGGRDLTLKEAIGGNYYPRSLRGVYPLADGQSFARISPDGKRIVKYAFKTGEETGVLFDAETARDVKVDGVEGYVMAPDESRILIQTETEYIYRRSKKATYYIYDVASRRMQPLSTAGKQQEPTFSPDGTQIAFVRDNNLFLVKLLFNNSESQVTKDGKFNEVLNGVPDWVNEEEFALSRAFTFSADSKLLAWIRYDESQVPVYHMQMFRGMQPEQKQYADYPGAYSYKYPVAGAQNATVTVHSFDIKSRVTHQMDVPLDKDGYIPRIKPIMAQPDQLAVVTLNRHQDNMKLYACNLRSGVCKLLLDEKDERYIREDAYDMLTFEGNNFVILSERSGMAQLYWYSLTGQLVKQLTNHPLPVTRYYGYDAKSGTFYYQAKDESPLRTAVYSTNLKGQTKKLSAQKGSNDATFSTGCQYFINVFSNLTTPPVTTLCTGQGRTEKTLIDNAELRQKLSEVNVAKKEFFTFKTSEGIDLNGWMMKPVNFDPNKKYPVILYQYSGPGSQCVNDAWGVGFGSGGLLESHWCSLGFIVACVDGRGTGGRGADFEKCTYQRLGKYESSDQVEAAIYLGGLSYVDKNNIGIWGWSYGGFNTLMSMSEGRPVFKAGVAVAPPTSWRYYDSIYTERYMRTPQENPDGYDDNALSRAKQLGGALLVCHGLADDNVHVRNTYEYTEALVQADKQFEMQTYTNRNHSIYGGNTRYHLMTRMTNFFKEHLLGK